MKFYTVFLFIMFLSIDGFAGKTPFDSFLLTQGFKEVSFDKISNLEQKSQRFFVYKKNGSYHITETKGKIGLYNRTEKVVNIGDYIFKGTDKGEWGGELSVKSNTTEEKTLIRDNIVEIIPVGNSLFVFGGIAHLTEDRGWGGYIENVNKSFDLKILTLLPGAPFVVLYDESYDELNDLFSIIGYSGFVEIYLNRYGTKVRNHMKVFYFDKEWGDLYPNSAIREGKYLLIGMRYVVAVLTVGYRNADIIFYAR